MKRVGLAIVVLVAIWSAAAPAAFAQAPEFGRCVKQAGGHWANSSCTKLEAGKEKFEWVSGVAKRGFQSTTALATLVVFRSVGAAQVTCRSASETGEISSPTSVAGVVITFTGCDAFAPNDCTNGQELGTVVTAPLEGVLGIQKVGTNPPLNSQVALELHAQAGENVIEFKCSGNPFVVRGSILRDMPANKMASSYQERYAQHNGEQKPDGFVGEPEDAHTLELSIAGGPFEELGWSVSFLTSYEEKVEISTVS
jgi:hypothetical protein